MSSVVVSTSAALGRPFVFDEEDAEVRPQASAQESVIARVFQSKIKNQQSTIPLTPASRLEIRPAPEMVSSGISALDALTGGLPRGCLTEICGPASSGRTTLLLAALAAATCRGEFCVVVDASDALDPHSAAAAGVELDRLLWVRCGEDPPQRHPATPLRACPEPAERLGLFPSTFEFSRAGLKENVSQQSEHRLEQVLRATDLLLESGGFGLIVLDLSDLPPQAARRIPLTTWFRFRRAIEHTPTILLAIEEHPIAGSCSSLLLQLGPPNNAIPADGKAAQRRKSAARGASRGSVTKAEKTPEGRKEICIREQSAIDFQFAEPAHAQLLTKLDITAELIRSRLNHKPAHSVTFATKTAWAG